MKNYITYIICLISFVSNAQNNTIDSINLDEVKISAVPLGERLKFITQQTAILDKSTIKNLNQPTLAEVLSQSGQIVVQKSQLGGGSPIVRGFEANKVLLVVDGIKMNNAIYRGGHLQNVITVDNNYLERIDLLFGSQSVAYGSDAFGGVLHFHTIKPLMNNNSKMLFKTNLMARYGTAMKEKTVSAQVQGGNNKFGFATSMSYSDFGDLLQGSVRKDAYSNFGKLNQYVTRINNKDSVVTNSDPNLQRRSGYTQFDFLQKLEYRFNSNNKILLNIQGSTTSNVNRYDRLTELTNGKPTNAEWFYGPQNRFLTAIKYTNTSSNMIYDIIELNVNFQNIDESRNSRKLNAASLKSQVENIKIFGGAINLRKNFNKNELDYGLDFSYHDVTSKATFTNYNTSAITNADTRYPDGGSNMNYLGIYAAHRIKLSDNWSINDGLRFSNVGLNANFVDKTFFPFPYSNVSNKYNALNFATGTAYQFNAMHKVYASINTGFRAPNIDDLGKVFDSKAGSLVVVPNPDLKAEKTYQFELGYNANVSSYFNIGVNGWYTLLKDGLVVAPFKFNGQDSITYGGKKTAVVSSQNVNEAVVYGFSVNIDGKFTNNIGYYGNATSTVGKINNTNGTTSPIDHIPPFYGKFGVFYNKSKLRIDLYSLFNGAKKLVDYSTSGEDNLQYATADGMPSWYTINARIGYQFIKNLSLQVACENIMDQNYRVFASGISAPGRNFVFTARYNF